MPKKKKLTSDSQLKAIAKYDEQFAKIMLRIKPEQKEVLAENLDGKSMNQYILDLIREDLKKKGVELP